MRILFLALTLSLTLVAQTPQVAVYMGDDPSLPMLHKSLVHKLVAKLYSDIGVTIRWELTLKRGTSPKIEIELRRDTPRDFMPEAMAYALPYEGRHIVVFYDRIAPKADAAFYLAYVIAHEIGHILQGVASHSETGIMKPSWSAEEQSEMRSRSLGFASANAERIRRGALDRDLQKTAEIR